MTGDSSGAQDRCRRLYRVFSEGYNWEHLIDATPRVGIIGASRTA
ncbi:MAG: hypothetical protein ACREQV_00010 [Candidatus Binatia bacterium]